MSSSTDFETLGRPNFCADGFSKKMVMPDDAQLLRQYAEDGSEAAFTALVERHGGLVYQAARRQLGADAHLSPDVTQAVFILLARKARLLCRHPSLAGWLYSTTHFTIIRTLRAEWRRRRREATAQGLAEVAADQEPDWARLGPVLDGAMLELSHEDREAVFLRYFQERPVAEVAARLRVTEAAAYKRVERAIERLRIRLQQRGITSSAGALAAILGAEAATGAPTGLTATVAGAALAGGAVPIAGWSLLTLMSTTKLTLGVFGSLAMVGAGIFLWREHQTAEHLAAANTQLQSENYQLNAENTRLAQQASHLIEQANAAHLSNLEAQVHARIAEAPKNPRSGGLTIADTLHNVGQQTAQAAAETFTWACDQANTEVLATLIHFEGDGRQQVAAILAALPESVRAQYPTPEALFALFFAADCLSHPPPPPDILKLVTESYPTPDQVRYIFPNGKWIEFHHTPDGWKYQMPAKAVKGFAQQFLAAESTVAPTPSAKN
jgi:RNA polymerase sigma factor (sigma-70 family)